MTEEEYRRLAAALDRPIDLAGLGFDVAEAAEREAVRRGDAATAVKLCVTFDEHASARLPDLIMQLGQAAFPVPVRRELIRWAAALVDEHGAWELLFMLVDVFPADAAIVRTAVAGWSAEARCMPVRWWADLVEGRWDVRHSIVGSLLVTGNEVETLLRPGVTDALSGLAALGVRAARPALVVQLLRGPRWPAVHRLVLEDLDWSDPAVAVELLRSTAFPQVRWLTVTGLPPAVRSDLLTAANFPRLESLTTGAP